MVNTIFARQIALLILLAFLAGCGFPLDDSDADDPKGRIFVFAAASTTNAVEAAAAAYHRETSVEVLPSFAASSALARQILSGAEAGVFISANVRWADEVQKSGLAFERALLASNRLVCAVPRGAERPAGPEELAGGNVKRVAVGDVEGVPAGLYARKALERLGLWKQIEPKAIGCANVRHALMLAERGEADAALVYATDAAISDHVEVAFELSPDLTGPIEYPVILLRTSKNVPAAKSFYEYLLSEEGREHFQRHGFLPPDGKGIK